MPEARKPLAGGIASFYWRKKRKQPARERKKKKSCDRTDLEKKGLD